MAKPSTRKASEMTTLAKTVPLRWFKFYVYVRIPLGIVVGLTELAHAPNAPTQVLLAASLGVLLALAIGLSRRRTWGWQLNWVVLGLEVILRPLQQGSHFVPLVSGAFLLWFLPNAVYFWKRRDLFTGDGS